jgi:flagellar basal-body rod protein FlgC
MMVQGPGGVFRGLGIASSGLTAQRTRMETIATNIANAETTRTADGTPYRRRVVELAEVPMAGADGNGTGGGVRVASVSEDSSEGRMVYDPGHPDADPSGYVEMPNVDMTTEMVDLMEARRVFEANASVFEAIKSMLSRSARI